MATNIDDARAKVIDQVKVDIFTSTQDEVGNSQSNVPGFMSLMICTPGRQEGCEGGLQEFRL